MQDVIQMPKIVVNVYSALILVLDSKIQDIGKETVKLHHVKIIQYATILPPHDVLAAQGSWLKSMWRSTQVQLDALQSPEHPNPNVVISRR